jgi:formylglycine-generating enzyme required for sulfatase activity
VHAFLIDAHPATNAQFAIFLQASGYAPRDAHNFLRDWAIAGGGAVPAGWDNKPVTWVDATDASAFCAFYGKRLPDDWEWQRAAQGDDGRPFPWGFEWDWTRLPMQVNGRERPAPTSDVGAHPQGASPFGMEDAMGLVWQWTNSFSDTHTRSALVRGGSYYRPIMMPTEPKIGYGWYFQNIRNDTSKIPLPNVPVTLASHSKLLVMAPSYDRHGTVGFRCAADVS